MCKSKITLKGDNGVLKKYRAFLLLLLTVLITVSGCIPSGNESEESDVNGLTYDDYKAPEGEVLDFGTVNTSGEPDKTRAINILNPVGALPVEDCIIYINKDYNKAVTVPENAYCIELEKAHLNNFKVLTLDVKSFEPNSGNFLIFIGEYNIEFAKIVYTEGKILTLNRLNYVSTVVHYPAVCIDDISLRINGNRANYFDNNDGIYLFDASYGKGYAEVGEKAFIQIAFFNNRIAYIGSVNEQVAIPGINGYLLSLCGEDAVKKAAALKVGQTAESFYLNINRGSQYTIAFGDTKINCNLINSTRGAKATVIYTPDYRFATTGTGEQGYEYTVSGGVVTAITTPGQGGGNALIPEDGFVISTLVDSSEYKLLKDLKIGDGVSLTAAKNIYIVNTLPFNAYNTTRQAEFTVIYNSSHGSSTRTNEWGYEIIVDKNGKVIGDDGDGNAAIPAGGFVISGIGVPRIKLLELYRPGASVFIDDEKKTFTVVYSPMDDYNEAVKRLALLKESAVSARNALLDIDHNAADALIAELDSAVDKETKATDTELASLRNNVVAGVKKLYNLLIPSVAVEDRGAWHVLSEKNDTDVRHTVKLAADLGLNYIIIDTWANGYTYYHTQLEGVLIHPRYTDFDPLESFIRIGHEYGLQIHASFSVFMAGGRRGTFPADHPTQRDGWLTLSRNGDNYGINGDGEFYTLNPYSAEVRAYLISVFKEVAERYDVDGIHYDYIRFPQPNPNNGDFGYNEDLMEAFKKKYKTSVNPVDITSNHPLWADWCQFRCDVISSFVKECTTEIKRIDSSILVTAAVFAGMEEMTTSIFQDARSWVSGGYIDGLFPMMYTPSIDNFDKYGKRALSATNDKAYLHIGLGTFEFFPNDTILWEINYTRKNNVGVCFFTLDSIIKEQYNAFVREGVFKRKAVTTDSPEAFSVAVGDLVRRIDEIYIPLSEGYDDKLNELKNLLETMTEKNIALVRAYAQANLDGAVLERVSESLVSIETLTIKKGFSLKLS
ncbi:MAG: hypothetical protein CVU97_04050 [Firmicutes bacterium HGW-Firmicutes-21]|nr:MAG: hypothetical protein CVU97_04050 [Firmicutes bacterium HGW-Firmicutes-21]